MAGSLKVKIGIAGFSIFVLVLIPLLENKFFAPVTIKRWGKVSWNDFQGIPQPFSSYGAVISSGVSLEYDSNRSRYVAYAGQNNIYSWVKKSEDERAYMLNHEQYHFDITEFHARMLNDYIEQNPDGTKQLYLTRLRSINYELGRMQDEYDNETDHSVNYDKQSKWEYRIDSLLSLESGWVVDQYSGGKVYFPSAPTLSRGIGTTKTKYRSYVLNGYDMELTFTSYQTETIADNLLDNVTTYYLGKEMKMSSIQIDSSSHDTRVSFIAQDTLQYRSHMVWVKGSNYIFSIMAKYSTTTGDTTGYVAIARSFINSFQIVDTDSYWLDKLETSNNTIHYSEPLRDDKKNTANNYCMTIGRPQESLFYRGPVYRDDGAMFIASDYLIHPDTVHYENVLLLNRNIYWNVPTGEEQIYFVPASNIPKEKYTIEFGYTLLQDSSQGCSKLYHETIEENPRVNTPAVVN